MKLAQCGVPIFLKFLKFTECQNYIHNNFLHDT